MGKKSKKQSSAAKQAKATTPMASASLNSSDPMGCGSAGDILTKNNAKQRCIECWALLKEGKGTSCPGCSLIFCWRCEKKYFEECPNGDECVHKVRRCFKCAGANNALSLLKENEPT